MKKICIIVFLILFILPCIAYAHKGKTDEYGGHYNNSTGTYHYHSGEYAETGEYTAPIEEDGTLIPDENTLKDGSGDLVIKDTSDELISSQQNEINSLQQQIYAKQDTIGNLTEQLDERQEKIEQLESNQLSLFIAFAIILLIAIYISYNIGSEKNKKQ